MEKMEFSHVVKSLQKYGRICKKDSQESINRIKINQNTTIDILWILQQIQSEASVAEISSLLGIRREAVRSRMSRFMRRPSSKKVVVKKNKGGKTFYSATEKLKRNDLQKLYDEILREKAVPGRNFSSLIPKNLPYKTMVHNVINEIKNSDNGMTAKQLAKKINVPIKSICSELSRLFVQSDLRSYIIMDNGTIKFIKGKDLTVDDLFKIAKNSWTGKEKYCQKPSLNDIPDDFIIQSFIDMVKNENIEIKPRGSNHV